MSRVSLFVMIAIIAPLLLLRLPGGSVEASDWAVMPAASGEMSPLMERVIAEVRRELERHGRHVWPSRTALTKDELDEWAQHSRAAIRQLTKGNHAGALHHLERAEQLSGRAVEELNRSPIRAQRVLDTCLYGVRALLETHDVVAAKAHAVECAVLVPRAEPATIMHPPLVVRLYEEARVVGREKAGNLLVESRPSGCDVRINGVAFGETPLETNELSAGEYAVQVECDEAHRGRIHSVKIGPEVTKLFIDARLDRVPPAHMVVLVSVPTAETIELELVSETGNRKRCARVVATAEGPSSEALALAVRDLVNGNCMDLRRR